MLFRGRTISEMRIVLHRLATVFHKINDSAYSCYDAGQRHAPTERIAHEALNIVLGLFVFLFHKASEISGKALINHIDSHQKNGHTKNLAKHTHIHALEQSGPGERPEQDTNHHRTGHTRLYIAPLNVNDSRGTGRNAHHEIAGSGTHLEGYFHDAVHRYHFEHTAADTEDARQNAGHIHHAETTVDVLELIAFHRAVLLRPRAEEFQPPGLLRPHHTVVVGLAPLLHGGGENEHTAVDNGNRTAVKIDSHGRATNGTYGSGYFKEHAQTDVGNALLHIGTARTARRGDGSHQSGAHGIVEVYAKSQRKQGNDNNAPSQSRERTEQTGGIGANQQNERKSKNGHRWFYVL